VGVVWFWLCVQVGVGAVLVGCARVLLVFCRCRRKEVQRVQGPKHNRQAHAAGHKSDELLLPRSGKTAVWHNPQRHRRPYTRGSLGLCCCAHRLGPVPCLRYGHLAHDANSRVGCGDRTAAPPFEPTVRNFGPAAQRPRCASKRNQDEGGEGARTLVVAGLCPSTLRGSLAVGG
jgi:hypothetical protein